MTPSDREQFLPEYIDPVHPGRFRRFADFFRGLAETNPFSRAPQPVADRRPLISSQSTYLFGGIEHRMDWAKLQFVAVGAPRSGKSVMLKLLARSALRAIAAGDSRRIVFFDYKREYEPWLRTILPEDRLKVIEPFDAAAAAWDIAADIQNVDQAAAIGKLLAPTRPDAREPYFEEAAGAIFAGILVSLHAARGAKWRLSDVMAALQSRHAMKACLELAPNLNSFRIAHYLSSKQMNRDVLGTLGNRIQDLAAAARHWDRARDRISLSEWMDGRCVLVIGHSHQHASATTAITRALFERLSQFLLDSPDIDCPQSWVFLDELPSAGRLEKLHDLLAKGPSRGVVAAVGFQDIGSLRHIYGADQAQAINSFLAHKAFFRMSDPDTAEWASRHFGEVEVVRPLVNQSWTSSQSPSSTFGVSQHFERKRVVPPTAFLEIPPLSPPRVSSLGSFIISPHLGRYPYELPLETIERAFPKTPLLALPPGRSQFLQSEPVLEQEDLDVRQEVAVGSASTAGDESSLSAEDEDDLPYV